MPSEPTYSAEELEEIIKLTDELRKAAWTAKRNLDGFSGGVEVDKVLEELEPVFDAHTELRDKVLDGDASDFAEFFGTVGQSLVSAQTKLDRDSREYLARTRRDPTIPPTTFRIPRVRASMKFALEKRKGSKLNLVFYQRSKTAKERHEQSLEFDIVTATPTPEAVAALNAGPDIDLVLTNAERLRLRGLVEEAQDAPSGASQALLDLWSDALIWATPTAGTYLIATADEGEPHQFGLWALIESPLALKQVLKHGLKTHTAREDWKLLHDSLRGMIEAQTDYLNRE